jgi:long-chain acyl-CoA synthetase
VCVLAPLRLGGKIVIAPSVAPPEPWLGQMKRQGVTIMPAVPQVYALVTNAAAGYRDLILREGYFSSLRICISGAAPLSPQTHKDVSDAFGLEIMEGYGLTECSPVAAITVPGNVKVGAVGPAIEGVSIKIVDENGKTLPPGEEGEVLISGPNVMKGYLDNEAATKEAVSGGWLRSGDIGTLDEEGYLFIRDRKKDMVIVKGLKVFPAMIEKILLSHPDVKEAAVIGIPDETGDERIKAFLVLKDGAKPDLPGMIKFCREKFDAYKRPRDFEYLAAIPKNALQKPLKRILRQKELEKKAVSAR